MGLQPVKIPVKVGQKVRFGREAFKVIEVYKERPFSSDMHKYSGWMVLGWRPRKAIRAPVEDFTWTET